VTTPHTHDIDHNHASFNSGGQSVNHTHTFSDTTSTTSSAGAHTHPPFAGADRYLGFNAGSGIGSSAATANDFLQGTATGSAGAHTHTVSVSGTTGANSAGHIHAIDIPALGVTASGAASGAIEAADVANANMPPYLGVPYIMRVA
jgi:hypothetical protein